MKKKVKVPYTLIRGDKVEHGELDGFEEDIEVEKAEMNLCPFGGKKK